MKFNNTDTEYLESANNNGLDDIFGKDMFKGMFGTNPLDTPGPTEQHTTLSPVEVSYSKLVSALFGS